MFKKIGDERAFNGILNQIIDNIQNIDIICVFILNFSHILLTSSKKNA